MTDKDLLGTLASETRLRVIRTLLNRSDGMRFSEIAKTLEIYPSTLEDHLKRLVKNEIIAHAENRYLATLNTELASWLVESMSPISTESYFSTHKFTISDSELKQRFFSLNYDVLGDLLTILAKARITFSGGIKKGFIGGSMNMVLEQGMLDLLEPEFKNSDIEVVFTRQGVEDLKNLDEPERFMDTVDISKTRIYIVDECEYAIGACESGGFLFLPALNSVVDFNQCLCLERPEGAAWLRRLFEYLKSKAEEISLESLLEKTTEK